MRLLHYFMRKGFSGQGLLETVVAIGIIMSGLLSVITLVVSNLATQREAAFRYQAANLAREGLEIVRNLRDSNWLAGQDDSWAGLTEGELVPRLSLGTGEIVFDSAATVSPAVYRCADGFYAQGSALCTEPTVFSRSITVDILDCGDIGLPCERFPEEKRARIAIDTRVLVAWSDRGQSRQVILNQVFYDWR